MTPKETLHAWCHYCIQDRRDSEVLNCGGQLVYATGRHHVSDVWIAGRARLQARELVDIDTTALVANARQWRTRIAAIRIS